MLEGRNFIEKAELDALFALGSNFFSQGQYRQAKVIFEGLKALVPDNEAIMRAAEECQVRVVLERNKGQG